MALDDRIESDRMDGMGASHREERALLDGLQTLPVNAFLTLALR
uniref:Uncharacterized protein n=1 Tax=Picea sitchensis TaxID=3332 RepID=A0A6B9XV91_PICSI|nr:hypothetical protein Q903MT_gene6899 [Picea sitchensis]